MAEAIKFDLEPYIRAATENVSIEIERRLAPKIAAELEKLGWTCVPPGTVTDQIPAEETDSRAAAWQEGWERGFRDMQAADRDEDGYVVVKPTPNPYRPVPEGSET